jgi:hypothetical protein
LSAVSVCTFQSGYPDAGLTFEVCRTDQAGLPTGAALGSILVLPDFIGWAPKLVTVHPGLAVQAGETYALILKSASSKGRYGFEYNDATPYPAGKEAYSSDSGKSYSVEPTRSLMFRTFVHAAEQPVDR